MANAEQLAILKQGVNVWNEWRQKESIHPDLSGAKLAKAELSNVDLHEANLDGTNLEGANLPNANLQQAMLRHADLSEAKLIAADLTESDISEARLFRTNLRNAKISKASLHGAFLRGASLWSVNLRGTNLRGAELQGSDLTYADLEFADLTDVDLSHADLSMARLMQTTLTRSNFRESTIGATVFADVDLSEVRALESVGHFGPSYIAIDTIYRSKGKISEGFLRKAGVPDLFIAFMKSLAGQAIEFYSCFISYSTKDQEFAERLYADLQANNVRCWFAPHDIQGGKKIHEQIDEAIRLHDKLLVILSPESIRSAWVETEIAKARKREVRDERRVLFPVRLVDFETLKNWECFDGDTGKDSAREIREYFIPDFSDWKNHDSYQKALKGLLKDLKAN